MLFAASIHPGPLFPGDKNLLAMAGASYALGFLVAAVISGSTEQRSEIVRRRVGAGTAVVLAVVWLFEVVARGKGYPLLPEGRLTLLDTGAAFSLGPLAATLRHIFDPLDDPASLEVLLDRRGLYIGVIAGVLAIGFWLAGGG